MALGTMSNLGLGSSVLTQDVINQLKENEESAMVSPYTTKIEKNAAKQKALTELKTKLLSFQTNVSSLGDATAFQKRSVTASVTGDSAAASLSADSGVSVQSLSVKVDQIAQKDVFQSKGIKSDTDRVLPSGSSATTFTLIQGDKKYSIRVDSNTTYADLVDKIGSASGGTIQAKMIKTGEANAPYRLTLSSKDTGTDNAIKFVDGDGTLDTNGNFKTDAAATDLLKNLGWELDKTTQNGKEGYSLNDPNAEYHIKQAQNAEFTLDGVKMIRQSNEVKDIGAGLTLTLKKAGEINFDVKQDVEQVSETMQSLVDSYNELMTNLQDATKYDTDTKVAGALQGISEITNIRSQIISALFETQSVEGTELDDNGNEKKVSVMVSLQDYGLTLNESGVLEFNKSTFEEKVADDVNFAEKFFSGTSGFEELNVAGSAAKFDADIDFSGKEFKIVFNEKTYDLSKNKDGTPFKLTGNTEEERVQNLVDHINSFGIEDLKVSVQELNTTSGKGYSLKFKSDNGSDFELKGEKTILDQLGLEETKFSPQIQQGTGIFSMLKTTLQGMTGKNGTLTLYDANLTSENSSLTESRKKTQESIDTRYETMSEKFIQYDKIIAKLKQQSSTITDMINAMNSSNS